MTRRRGRRAPVRRAQPAPMGLWLVITIAVVLWIKYQETH